MHTVLPILLTLLQGPSDPDWLGAFIDGNRALERGDARAAKTALETALAALPEHPVTAWQLACACARLNEDDAAFAWLERVVAWGGGEPALLAWDPDLASLREDPRFAHVAESLAARAPDPAEPIQGRLVLEGGGAITSVGPGARTVATGRGAGTLIFDTTTDEIVAALDRPGEDIASVFVSPDGRHVVAGGSTEGQSPEHFLRVFDASTGDLVVELDDVGWQPWTQFSRDGRRMLAAGGTPPQRVVVWNTADWSKLPALPAGLEQRILSPDGTRVLLLERAGNAHSDVVLWDVDAGKEVRRHDELATIPNTELGFSSDGALALVVENGRERVLILDGRTGEVVQTWEPTTKAAPGTRSFNASCLVGARGEFALIDEKLRIEVRDARTGEVRRTFQLPGEPGWRGIECSVDGRSLLVSGFGSSTAMVDADDGSVLWRDEGQSGFGTGFAADGESFVHGSWREPPQIRATRTGRTLYEVRAPGRGSAFEADPTRDEVWVGAEDGSVRCVTAATGRTLRAWKLAEARIHDLESSPDSAWIATLDSKGGLRIVDTSKSAVAHSATSVANVEYFGFDGLLEFSPVGDALIVVEKDFKLGVYAAPAWERRCTIGFDERRLGQFAWSPDGTTVAVGASAGMVRLHDARDGSVRGEEMRIEGEADALAFEPDGAKLWIGSDQSKVHVFRTADQKAARVLDLSDLDFAGVELGSIEFRRDGKLGITASSGYGVVAAWDPTDGRRVWHYEYGGGNPAPLHSAFAADGERAFVWGQTWWTSRVVDARTGAKLLDFAGRLGTLMPLPGKERLAGLGHEGLEIVDLRDGRTLWTRGEVDAEGWLLSTPARFVDGTREALERIPFAMANGSLPLDALAAALLDPKKVRAAAEGVAMTPARVPAIPMLHATEPHERVVTLAADAKAHDFKWVASCPDGVRGFEIVLEGRRFVTDGDAEGPNKRTLQYEIDAEPGTPTDLRLRAISRRGILSRALRVTVRRN